MEYSIDTDLRPQLTEGSLVRSLVRFTIPFLLANVLQVFYGTADLLIVGQFSSRSSALAALPNASQIIHVITFFITGFASGGMVLIGQQLGAQRYEEIRKSIWTILSSFAILGAGLSILTVVLSPWILRVMNVPEESMAAAHDYMVICGGGLILATGYNVFSAILRGLGDSKSPLIFIAIACGINVFGDLLLVAEFGLGPAGAAYATVAAQGISVLFAAWQLQKVYRSDLFVWKTLRIDFSILRSLIKLGLPVAAEGLLGNVSFMFINAMINRHGLVASSAIGVIEKVGSIVRLPASSVSMSVSAMVAQNIGADNVPRAKKTLYCGILSALCLSLFTFAAMRFAPDMIMQLYTPDMEIIAAGREYMRSFSYDTLFVCGTFCMAGFFSGCGKSLFTLARNLISTLLIRVPLAYYFCHITPFSMFQVGLAAPIASVASILIGLIYLKSGTFPRSHLRSPHNSFTER